MPGHLTEVFQSEVPVAQEVREQLVRVNEDKLIAALADERIKIDRAEAKRFTDSKIQFERMIKDEEKEKARIEKEILRKNAEADAVRRDAEWCIQNPGAAQERERLKQQKQQEEERIKRVKMEDEQYLKDREQRRQNEEELMLGDTRREERRTRYRSVGGCLIGAGLGLLFMTAML